MTISIVADNIVIPVLHITFSDGASSLKLDIPADFKPKRTVSITVEPHTPVNSYLTEISLAKHAIQLAWETFSSTKPEYQVILTDPHSDYLQKAFPAHEWMITVYPQHRCAIETIPDIVSGDVIVAPDEGALKKIYHLQTSLKNKGIDVDVITASKTRDVSTGRITSVTLTECDLTNKRCIIIDDIADGGGTFIPLAEALRTSGASRIELYVTHGIFAKGLEAFKGLVAAIHV